MNDQTALVTAQGAGLVPDMGAATRYLAKLSPTGAAAMRSSLGLAARLMGAADLAAVPWNFITADLLETLARMATDTPTERGTKRAPASVAMLVSAVKGACKASWKAGHLSSESWERIRDVKPPAGSRLPAGRNIGTGEKVALLRAVAGDDGPTGRRDAAILALFMGTGMRRKELATLALADLDMASGRGVLIGKGDKAREFFPAPGALAALMDWLAIRGHQAGPLFCPIRKGGALGLDAYLTPGGVSYIIERRRALAGVAHMTPHDLRRTVAGDLLDAGADLSTVQKTLGHSDPKITARYDRRGSRAVAAAGKLLDVPYKQPRRAQAALL